MTTIEKIRSKIQEALDAEGDSESAKAQALALFWVLELIDKYAEQEPCDDVVSREAVLQAVSEGCFELRGVYGRCEELINSLPSVRPQEPKTGHWIILDDCEQFIAKCSKCGRIEDSRMISKYTYCHCGAKMVEPQESEGTNEEM